MLQLLYEQSQQNAQSASSSPTTPTYKRHIQLLDPERRRSSCFHRSSSYEPFSPIRDEPISNLVRMRNNSSLGNSDPSLSTSSVSFLFSYFSFFFFCKIFLIQALVYKEHACSSSFLTLIWIGFLRFPFLMVCLGEITLPLSKICQSYQTDLKLGRIKECYQTFPEIMYMT